MEAKRYDVIQKLAGLAVIIVLLPVQVLVQTRSVRAVPKHAISADCAVSPDDRSCLAGSRATAFS